jgi:hypothetical protein
MCRVCSTRERDEKNVVPNVKVRHKLKVGVDGRTYFSVLLATCFHATLIFRPEVRGDMFLETSVIAQMIVLGYSVMQANRKIRPVLNYGIKHDYIKMYSGVAL